MRRFHRSQSSNGMKRFTDLTIAAREAAGRAAKICPSSDRGALQQSRGRAAKRLIVEKPGTRSTALAWLTSRRNAARPGRSKDITLAIKGSVLHQGRS